MLLPLLVVIVFLFSVVDVYYIFDIKREGALQELKPAFQHQKEQIKHIWHEVEDVLDKDHEGEFGSHAAGVDSAKSAAPGDAGSENTGYDAKKKHSNANDGGSTGVDVDADVDHDKEEIYEILSQAGIDRKDLDVETRRSLPTWTEIQRMYGTHPLIYGLERCDDFVNNVDKPLSFLGIAGTFNSGTNLLASLLIQNCQITERMEKYGERQKGMRWQVPWGKHTPVQYREEHVTSTDKDVPLENSFPMISIRDPYRWMMSMCRHHYTVFWPHKESNCPHLFNDNLGEPTSIKVKYDSVTIPYPSLPALYNNFYNAYLNETFPRVLVRFEDLLFYGKNVTTTLCKCGGGVPRRSKFKHIEDSAKIGTAAHGADKTSLLQAIIRYGKDDRAAGFSDIDKEWARKLFDQKLLDMFQYSHLPAE